MIGKPTPYVEPVVYYHGGAIGRARGAFLLPPTMTKAPSCSDFGAESVHRRDRVYVTTDKRAALLYAAAQRKGVIYEVEPEGLEPDPDCTAEGLSFQCLRARVVRITKPSHREIHMARHALLAEGA